MSNQQTELQKIAEQIAEERDTDTLVYIGAININSARYLVDIVGRRNRRKNLLFVLGTNGGDAHAGYKIARFLQHAYEEGTFTIAVYGDCKSAGTLIAIAANSIVMCQHGELGPLDVQLHKEDQLFAHSSGLTPKQALESLKEEALSQFEHFMLAVHARSGYQISTRLAANIGIRMAVGLLGPIYEQIDPLRIGETQRALDVATAYGERLNTKSNLKADTLKKLIEGYPSHDFAIDYDEAKGLFENLSRTDELQRRLGEQLAHLLLRHKTISQEESITVYINQDQTVTDTSTDNEKTDSKKESHVKQNPSTTGGSGKGESATGRPSDRSSQRAAEDGEAGARTTVKTSGNGE